MRQLLESESFRSSNQTLEPKWIHTFTRRNDIHVIDLQQTVELIKDAYNYVKDTVSNKGTIYLLERKNKHRMPLFEVDRCKMPYVNQRWLGGTLTTTLPLVIVLKN